MSKVTVFRSKFICSFSFVPRTLEKFIEIKTETGCEKDTIVDFEIEMNSKNSEFQKRAEARKKKFLSQSHYFGNLQSAPSTLVSSEEGQRLLNEFYELHALSCMAYGVPCENKVDKSVVRIISLSEDI